ncbi:short chain dehydrogenase/reductase family oxidoreductase [Achlya hypogyna]|uniref:Short chain dehydrogenase/reductase family oxidoreductase n=1 Tax=Achlya hypogyna TaxID=1202772 RepID=A0A1V9YFI8_ACHHY|nr:short chain dehydrogenase/reductase family oxidoreductase [Achlya hypogyna]
MTLKLAGKVALVTGASRGIGRAIAARLAADGASVVINYASCEADAEAAVAATQQHFTIPSQRAIHVRADTAQLAECRRLVDETMAAFGRLDILVLNAGILTNQSLDQITEESFEHSIAVNVKGPLFLTQIAAPHLTEGGRVVFISSTLTAFSGIMPNYTLYATTKGAVEQLSRTLAKDLGRRGITVNTVSPGPTATELFFKDKSEATINMFKSLAPTGRLGEPQDIANVVAFIASPDAAWVNGQNIRANGGYVV